MFYASCMEQNKKQTPGCFVILSSSTDCKNLDSETQNNNNKLLSTQYRYPPYYATVLVRSVLVLFVCLFLITLGF